MAADFAAGGQDFMLAGRHAEAARAIAATLGGHAEAVSLDEAFRRPLRLLPSGLTCSSSSFSQYGQQLAGKVIIDPTNPVGPTGEGGDTRRSSGSRSPLVRSWPACSRPGPDWSRHSAVFPRGHWPRRPGRNPTGRCCYFAADDETAGDLVAGLIGAAGFDPVRVGGLDQSIRIEMFGDLHEYGSLGRS